MVESASLSTKDENLQNLVEIINLNFFGIFRLSLRQKLEKNISKLNLEKKTIPGFQCTLISISRRMLHNNANDLYATSFPSTPPLHTGGKITNKKEDESSSPLNGSILLPGCVREAQRWSRPYKVGVLLRSRCRSFCSFCAATSIFSNASLVTTRSKLGNTAGSKL